MRQPRIQPTGPAPLASIIIRNAGVDKTDHTKLGAIMMQAGLIGEIEMLVAVEQSQRAGQRLGDWLVEQRLVTREAVSACLDAQHVLACGVLKRETAVWLIRRAIADNVTVPELLKRTEMLSENEHKDAEMVRLLQVAGIVPIPKPGEQCYEAGVGRLAWLTLTGQISPNVYNAALRLMDKTPEEAVALLRLVNSLNCTLDEATQIALNRTSGVFPGNPDNKNDAPLPGRLGKGEEKKRSQRQEQALALLCTLSITAITYFVFNHFLHQVPLPTFVGIMVFGLSLSIMSLAKIDHLHKTRSQKGRLKQVHERRCERENKARVHSTLDQSKFSPRARNFFGVD